MVGNHTLRVETSLSSQCEAKVQLQQDIQASFEKLKTAWATKIELNHETKDVEELEEDVTLDDLYKQDDSDIMSLDSDSDEDSDST